MKIFSYKLNVKKEKPLKDYKPMIKPKLDLDMAEIQRLKQKGLSNVKVAKLMKVSEGTIRNRLKEMQINE